ncbi:MAG: proteasome activator [Actinomycetota bacterium]
MSEGSPHEREQPQVVVVGPGEAGGEETMRAGDEVAEPAKVMRIASMVRTLLDEVRAAPLDDASRARLKEIYQTSVQELGEVLSEDLREELDRLSFAFDGRAPSDAELRVAHAQLVGWLEGLFHGIQAMLFAQQMESRNRLEELRRHSLPPGPQAGQPEPGPGQYL